MANLETVEGEGTSGASSKCCLLAAPSSPSSAASLFPLLALAGGEEPLLPGGLMGVPSSIFT